MALRPSRNSASQSSGFHYRHHRFDSTMKKKTPASSAIQIPWPQSCSRSLQRRSLFTHICPRQKNLHVTFDTSLLCSLWSSPVFFICQGRVHLGMGVKSDKHSTWQRTATKREISTSHKNYPLSTLLLYQEVLLSCQYNQVFEIVTGIVKLRIAAIDELFKFVSTRVMVLLYN